MKAAVISYSLTGNNDALAASIATALAAAHVKVIEPTARTTATIYLDVFLHRTPKIQPLGLEPADMVLFVGPVWIGHVATPLRAAMRQLKATLGPYAFISISGGADGPNPKLAGELKRITGKEPVAVIDLHIADLLPPEPKPIRAVTSVYRINETEVRKLTDTVVSALRPRGL